MKHKFYENILTLIIIAIAFLGGGITGYIVYFIYGYMPIQDKSFTDHVVLVLFTVMLIVGPAYIFIRAMATKIEITEQGIAKTIFGKKLQSKYYGYFSWNEITDVRMRYGRAGYILCFLSGDKELKVFTPSKKMLKAMYAVCPYMGVKVMIKETFNSVGMEKLLEKLEDE